MKEILKENIPIIFYIIATIFIAFSLMIDFKIINFNFKEPLYIFATGFIFMIIGTILYAIKIDKEKIAKKNKKEKDRR